MESSLKTFILRHLHKVSRFIGVLLQFRLHQTTICITSTKERLKIALDKMPDATDGNNHLNDKSPQGRHIGLHKCLRVSINQRVS